jgi:hypothetical protein
MSHKNRLAAKKAKDEDAVGNFCISESHVSQISYFTQARSSCSYYQYVHDYSGSRSRSTPHFFSLWGVFRLVGRDVRRLSDIDTRLTHIIVAHQKEQYSYLLRTLALRIRLRIFNRTLVATTFHRASSR